MSGATGALVGAALVGAGATVYSSNQASSAARRANSTANRQVDISQQLVDQTDPLRQALIDRSQNFLSPTGGGATSIFSDPTYLAYKDAADRNFSHARDNILATGGNGGALLENLANLQGQRASTLTQGAGSINDAELSRALSLATGQLPVAMNGFATAGMTQANNANALALQSSQKADSLGSAAGAYAARNSSSGAGTGKKS